MDDSGNKYFKILGERSKQHIALYSIWQQIKWTSTAKKDGFQDHDFTFLPKFPIIIKTFFLWLDIGKSTFRGSQMARGRWGYIEDISSLSQTGLMSNPTLSSKPMKWLENWTRSRLQRLFSGSFGTSTHKRRGALRKTWFSACWGP